MSKIRYNINTCDHNPKYSELMIHFTKACPNKCEFCIDRTNIGVGHKKKPDIDKIISTIDFYKDRVNYITISGGEPCIYLDELKRLVDWIKDNEPRLNITLISSIPNNCYSEKEKFFEILDRIDNLQISLQHYSDITGDKIRKSKSTFDRKEFYIEILARMGVEKVLGSINIIKPYFTEKDDIINNVLMFNQLGFKNIKICEIFDADKFYVDIPSTLGIKMNSPFAWGCKTEYPDAKKWILYGNRFDGTLYIKRSCFYRTRMKEASIWDFIKVCTRWIFAKKYFFGVIHEDGTIAPYWV